MDINNIQALIAQGLLTDVASVDPNKAYVAVGVFQPGNRQSGPAGNAYPSYAMPISEFLAGVAYTASKGISIVGNDIQLTSNNISQFTNDSGYITSAAITGMVTGSGTVNKLARWTPSGAILGDSLINDDSNVLVFNSNIDGTTSGNNNFEYRTSTGSIRSSYYGSTGLETIFDFYTNGVKNSSITEVSGYLKNYVKNRYAVIDIATNKSKLFVDMATGFTGIGDDYFAPAYRLHVNISNNEIGSLVSNNVVNLVQAIFSNRALIGTTSASDLGFITGASERMTILSTGNVGIGTTSASARLHVKSINGYNQLRLETTYTPTSSADVNGSIGDIAWDDSFIYTKVSTGWKRAILTAF